MRYKINGTKETKILLLYMFGFSGWLILAITYIWNYLIGNQTITINTMGEMNIEFIFIIICTLVTT